MFKGFRAARSFYSSMSVSQSHTRGLVLPAVLEKRRPKQCPEIDYSTLSNYRSFQVQHSTLDLQISFQNQKISGDVHYDLRNLDNSSQILLDTSFLDVLSVSIDGVSTEFEVEPRKEPLGSRLVVHSAKKLPEQFQLSCQFSTTEKCTALQWLEGHQTSGKPYVFSQLEAIHARALFPCFDTPSAKSTFTANITSPLPTVFSGISTSRKTSEEKTQTKVETDTKTYHFKQDIPIPAYLIGIASGDLQSADVGPRSKVYTEPVRLQDAQWEFDGDVETFIQAAENIIYAYEWGTYDILINPNSYPYGGMESPNMTFATPTLIAHDKSNVDVIAHELAHSWSGNLVTNCSWDHFWLNEGWTVYLERRIMGAIHGEATRHFSALIGWNDLGNSINSMKNPDRFSTLVQNLKDGTDPDEAFSTVPYEKGSTFLMYLETLLGGKEAFDPFIKHYFRKFARQSLDTWQFFDALFEFYADKRALLETVDWEKWFFTPGMPPKPELITTLADDVYALAEKWISKAQTCHNQADFEKWFCADDVKEFSSNQMVLLLDSLVQVVPQAKSEQNVTFDWSKNRAAAQALLAIYRDKSLDSRNAEVVFRTFRFEIMARMSETYPKLAEWLGTVGRMKFVRPGYRLLNTVDRDLAVNTFDKLKDIYHPICRAMVKQDLGL
ncbi:LAME_0G13102g1_1 [Lachancea meyersii CBS 8951]|uniref:Leukotriene A(4) hydrolase n=1 Tax=Lachancea meyersii CBS 8951 TaxID=1266667 RepID=A0A1G4K9W0_9SACH|nr:LAME_0G13102g1_1 [Lachancea meyersii CBS 8951]